MSENKGNVYSEKVLKLLAVNITKDSQL